MKNFIRLIWNKAILLKSISLISIFIFVLTCLACNKGTNIKTAEEKEREMILQHKIKCIKVYETDYRIGMALPEFLAQVRTYNADGLRTDELNYNDSIRAHSVIQYDYDKNGNLISSISKGPDSNLIFREIRKYNEQNKLSELIFYLPDGNYKYRNVSTYDDNGNVQQLAWYWPEGLRAVNKYAYANGLKTEDVEYNPQGKFNYKWVYAYDKNKNQTEATQYYPDSLVSAKIISEYNNNNQLISQTTFFGNSFQGKFVMEYDNKNLISVKSKFSSPKLLSAKYRYQYDFY